MVDLKEQIKQTHAAMIVDLARLARKELDGREMKDLTEMLKEDGWDMLVEAVIDLTAGEMKDKYQTLDEEDTLIYEIIKEGVNNPESLPTADAMPEPAVVAPSIAQMIYDATMNNAEALEAISGIRMALGDGENAPLGEAIQMLVEGERNLDKLSNLIYPAHKDLITLVHQYLTQLEAST